MMARATPSARRSPAAWRKLLDFCWARADDAHRARTGCRGETVNHWKHREAMAASLARAPRCGSQEDMTLRSAAGAGVPCATAATHLSGRVVAARTNERGLDWVGCVLAGQALHPADLVWPVRRGRRLIGSIRVRPCRSCPPYHQKDSNSRVTWQTCQESASHGPVRAMRAAFE